MRLLINTATTFKGGGVQVAQSFLRECRSFTAHEYHVVLGLSLDKLIQREDYPANFYFYAMAYRPATRVISLRPVDRFFKDLEEKIRPDVVFTTSGPAYWRPSAPHLTGFNLPHYIYRDSPFFKRIPLWKRLRWRLKGALIRYYFRRDSDALVVQTDDVGVRARRWTGLSHVYTVTNTYGGQYEKPVLEGHRVLPMREPEEKRFLMLSAWYAHKNFEIINGISAILDASMRRDLRFVVTLPTDIYERIFTAEARKRIYNIGPVGPDQCPSLYAECDFVFLPTLLECFSATYAEGMKMGKPILTSDLSFAHTVCGEAAMYFDPTDAGDAVAKMVELAEDGNLQEYMVAKGSERLSLLLSSEARAAKYLEICDQLAKADWR